MAHVWVENQERTSWAISPLTRDAYSLSEKGLSALGGQGNGNRRATPPVLIVRRDSASGEQWLLLARLGAEVQVNGAPLVLGVRLLRDRDNIALHHADSDAAFRGFFSAEQLAQVVPYAGGDSVARCPRCKQPIRKNQLAVRCPNPSCGAWHHQEGNLPCWTYSATCALCDRPTQLDAGFRWTPEEL